MSSDQLYLFNQSTYHLNNCSSFTYHTSWIPSSMIIFAIFLQLLVFSKRFFMKLGNYCIASLIFYGEDLFCSILNGFYSQNNFILGYSGVIKNIKNSFIFIWIGSIFHICLRWCFRKFHIAASVTSITIFFETIWELSTKISFSKGIMYLNFIINLVAMADLHLFFISYVLILLPLNFPY